MVPIQAHTEPLSMYHGLLMGHTQVRLGLLFLGHREIVPLLPQQDGEWKVP